MELGNMIYGNSRGEYSIPDRMEWQKIFYEFLDKVNIDGYGYTDKGDFGYENEVFKIMPYLWDIECDCGYDELEEEWWKNHKHNQNCFSVRLEKYEQKLEKQGLNIINKEYIELIDKWAKENGYKDGWEGSGVYCDCGINDAFDEWSKNNYHKDNCILLRPNFLYKPSNFQIQWYKYALRDSYMNQDISLEEFKNILNHCVKSYK